MGVLREEVAKNLLYYRKKNGMTQKELANKLGVKNNTISQWENGTNSIDVDTLLIVCNILSVAFEDMFGIYAKRQKDFSIEEEEIIEAYRRQPELRVAVKRVLGIYKEDTGSIKERSTAYKTAADEPKETIEIMPDEYAEFMKDRDAFIKKHAQPYAAAGGDTTNLDEAQEDYDNALKNRVKKDNE